MGADDRLLEQVICDAAINSTTPYRTVGAAAKWFSPIHPVANENNESQNNKCRLAQSIAPVTTVQVCS
ncbi:MAG TPA: hypothetical protein VK638_46690, partial [Edaphobacter sp.]|nr:hypothetical protein [Edaphobacter sp.]